MICDTFSLKRIRKFKLLVYTLYLNCSWLVFLVSLLLTCLRGVTNKVLFSTIVHVLISLWSVYQDIIQSAPNSQESTMFGVCSLQLAINFLFHTYFKTKKKLRLDKMSHIYSVLWYMDIVCTELVFAIFVLAIVQCPQCTLLTRTSQLENVKSVLQ